MASIFVLNGVNLGSLGECRPELYGEQTLNDIEHLLRDAFPDVQLEFRQTDHEGEFISWIHEATNSDGLVLNAGDWTHYSYAIHDALETISAVATRVGDLVGRRCGRRRDGRVWLPGGGGVRSRRRGA